MNVMSLKRKSAPYRVGHALLRGGIAAALLLCLSAAWAVEPRDNLGDEKIEVDDAEILGDKAVEDFELLRNSHLSPLAAWDGVQQKQPPTGGAAGASHWRAEGGPNGSVAPLDSEPITTLLAVPEDAAYRVYLRHQLGLRDASPVTLTLTPQPAPAGAAAEQQHVFGQRRLDTGTSGREQEKKAPLRFERETQRIAAPSDPLMVWEYWDVTLKKGRCRAALAATDKRVRASALFITRSRDFRPSLAAFPKDRTLGRIFLRFRAIAPSEQAGNGNVTVNAGLGYHWRGRRLPGATEDSWAWAIGTAPATPPGEWSPFIEATDAIVPGPGPWSTCNLSVTGLPEGELELQFAWHPHEGATLITLRTGIGGGRGLVRVPNGDWGFVARPAQAGWGVWSEVPAKQLLTQEAVVERYFTWAQAAADRLQLKPDHPRPKLIRFFCGNGVLPRNQDRAAAMLATLGVNWLNGASADTAKKYGLLDELSAFNTADPEALARGMSEADRRRLTKVKVGDEIGTSTPAAAINADPTRRTAFMAYLREQARLEDMELTTFLGIQDPEDIACLATLSTNPGRFERRLFYHSQRFSHLTTCEDYAAITRGFEQYFPNVHVYNNYSPHPLFLTGATMNDSDWFVLPRHQAQTLGWAEDWATGGGWGLGTAYQCTSFYAALVDCAVRKHGYPSGFYVGSNCGGSAQKIFGCVAEGLSWLHLYDWGPIDCWAEGSNAWSENESEYYAVMCATAAIGPADEILARGRREPRRTALLYNRSHEIMNEGTGRLNHDWMWTFIALKNAHIPVDVIIEEDLNPADLKRYDCVILGGFNLASYHLAALTRWVEAGGLLIGTGGAARTDLYGDPLPQTVALFGARQKPCPPAKDRPPLTVPASEWFPATQLTPGGLLFQLTPTTGTPLATYADGTCAATVNAVGKGHALLLGFHPGFTYRDNDRATGQALPWLAAPVLKRLGRQRVEFDYPASEATLFEHDSGLAVMLADFGGASPAAGSHLSIQTDRQITAVTSALHGPLKWQQAAGRVEITTQRLDPVDVVILK